VKFAYTRLVTEDVSSLASFYEKLLVLLSQKIAEYLGIRGGLGFASVGDS
jgi:hypothetical protein